jgi:queuine tRNA-ribosyltransferase
MTEIQFKFTLEAKDPKTAARAGFFESAHARTETPAFMPVATHAALRGIQTPVLEGLGYTTILANTYHLLLRPGTEVFDKVGGIHKFMRWPNSVLTDSGGFQIFSMSEHLSISEEGAKFRSYVDGTYILLSPERSIQTQKSINSDIMMVLDQCIPSLSDRSVAEKAMDLTYRWAKRSFIARGDSQQALFGIVQGACFPDLRTKSAKQITSINFDGFAIGGVAVGEEKQKRDDIISHTALLLPEDKPRYVMGIGTPLDLLEAVKAGVDMFDCILPAALGQQGVAFTSNGKTDLRRGLFKFDQSPIDSSCDCHTCRTYTRAYLHHLIKASEFIGGSLIATHNLYFYKKLVEAMRKAIFEGRFTEYYNKMSSSLALTEKKAVAQAKPPSKDRPLSLGKYCITENGSLFHIQHVESKESMHSVLDPNQEATELYVEQSRLSYKLCNHDDSISEIVVWDVGLGAAHNAMATINLALKLQNDKQQKRVLKLISFENDLDSLKLAIKHKNKFSHLRHQAPEKLLQQGIWQQDQISWHLIEGDFKDKFCLAEKANIIFFDPFSYKTNSDFWSYTLLAKIYKEGIENDAELFTYSASTAFRAALLLAGFYVAKGKGSGPKQDTTAAIKLDSPKAAQHFEFLDSSWLERWTRSDNKLPEDLKSEELETLAIRLKAHPQFSKTAIA